MTHVTLFTSGSTKEPKEIRHLFADMQMHIQRSIDEIGLTDKDTVLDVYPHNTIAHFTVTGIPAITAKSNYIAANFNPYTYFQLFNKYRPTYISLIPRHWDILKNTKEWNSVDMSCVRYMVMGSGSITQEMINDFRNRGVKTVANWYGMTEMPPPVFIGYNTAYFDFTPLKGYHIEFTDEGECIINGFYTNDMFDVKNRLYLGRKNIADGTTWKNNF